MLPNGHQHQQYAPTSSTQQSNPVGTMDGSRGLQNGANSSNLNAGFSNISLSENKSSSPAMPQFRPSLPVFRPPASLQSSGYGTESSGSSTPTATRPAMPSFPRMPQFASPTLSTSASHPVLPTGMNQKDYQTIPQSPLQNMQDGVGHAQQGQMPNSLSHPSRLNYFDQNQPQPQPNSPSSSHQEYYSSTSHSEPQYSSANTMKPSNSFAPGIHSADVENNLYPENSTSQVNQQPYNQSAHGQNSFNQQSSNGQFGQAAS